MLVGVFLLILVFSLGIILILGGAAGLEDEAEQAHMEHRIAERHRRLG